ncbi:hypothetical protein M431DRAFT_535204 [Trichoderma harzianum CBS 226.95]|uniref:Zn(2)-C6 fungal-type domain-containing protein n=1 Tax=Trichoderma harzianum CBS 226.95 TaxID=983964 RepID=A0A2T3ZW36_TRIHA|nr:hypothetical protein M431DRAFT_535204 [Trichoderma harzianum CBS 226.95]PTB49022.1 hypothetical protein M431DRAFT_535204 [Trichoderma harzianum CBS 226.95]
MTTSTAKDGCALQACSNCRVRKKKCDKVFPSCTTCRKKFINCNYEENRSQHEIRTLRSQLESLSNGLTVAGGPSLIPLSLDSTTQHYPIPSQWYMPFLVNHYYDLCFPRSLRTNFNHAPEYSRNQWMQASFQDPCMFHAILFAASSHLEVVRGENGNPVTHYHRRQAIKLLLENISASRTVSDTSIATAMYLWHYESMNSHLDEARIHKQGLLQMINANGGLRKLGFDGFLSHMITLIGFGDAILSASKPVFGTVDGYEVPEAPITLLSAILQRPEKVLHSSGLNGSLLSLLHEVHDNLLTFGPQNIPGDYWEMPLYITDKYLDGDFDEDGPFYAACWHAASIYLNSLKRGIPFSSDENQIFVEKLRSCIMVFPKDNDRELDREIYVWLCFTGAAVANRDKTWFLAKVGPTVMSLSQKQLGDFKRGVIQFAYIVQKLESSRQVW